MSTNVNTVISGTNPSYSDFDYIVRSNGSTIYAISPSGEIYSYSDDIAAALKSLITATNLPNGGKVLIDYDGTLNSKSASTIDGVNNLHIVGSPNLTIKANGFTAATVWDALKFENCDNVIIEGFTIDGSGSEYRSSFGLPLNDPVEGNQVSPATDDKGNCLHFDTCDRHIVRNMTLKNGLFHGYFGSGATTLGQLIQNILTLNGYRGAHIHGADAFSIDGFRAILNECYSNGQDSDAATNLTTGFFMAFENMFDVVISQNHIHDEALGVELSGQSAGGSIDAEKVIFSNNTIETCTYGIRVLVTLNKTIIAHNTVRNCTVYGIEINTGTNIVISHNVIAESGNFGLYFNNAAQKHITVQSNIFSRNEGGGARIYGSYIDVSGNMFEDNTVDSGGFKDQLFLHTATKATISNNHFSDDNWANTGRSIYLNAACKDCHVQNNICKNSGVNDIRVDNGAVGILAINNKHNNALQDLTIITPVLVVVADVPAAFN